MTRVRGSATTTTSTPEMGNGNINGTPVFLASPSSGYYHYQLIFSSPGYHAANDGKSLGIGARTDDIGIRRRAGSLRDGRSKAKARGTKGLRFLFEHAIVTSANANASRRVTAGPPLSTIQARTLS